MHVFTATLAVALLALLVESCSGYPDQFFRRIGHPVTWMGRLIAALDGLLNRPHLPFGTRRRRGVASLAILIGISFGVVLVGQAGLAWLLGGLATIPLGILASTLVAQRSLHDHVARVADGLDRSLTDGRSAVSQIVGRDPQSLDEASVARAAIESLAENFSDGVVAPVLYTALFGLPGGVVYKAVNTADSMIGHRTVRHEAYGWAAARLDDWINLPASRLSAGLIILAAATVRGCSAREAMRAVRRDAGHHRSPNAGWPEAAMAGALGLRLAGPRIYGGVPVHDHWMGKGRADARSGDIRAALRIYRVACVWQAALVAALLSMCLIAAGFGP